MADTPPPPAARGDTGARPDRGTTATYPGPPRWLTVSAIVVVGLVLLVVVVLLVATALGLHTPGGPAGHGR
jgi:hypothetical protein